jgi:histidine phosphotransferase ChpT
MPSPLYSDSRGPDAHGADMSPVEPIDLAARLAARLCHDFISPVSAIVSGLDLIEDPEQQDMREEAMALIASSAKKLAAHLSFARIAFGGSAAAESFDVRELEKLSRDLFDHARSNLEWSCEPAALEKPAARAMLNLAQLGASVLPVGGIARLEAKEVSGEVALSLDATGARARLRPEASDGLMGRPFGEGLAGHWVQAFFLRSVIDQAGGRLEVETEDEAVRVRVRLPIRG